MQLTDPVSEAATDSDDGDTSDESELEQVDDAALDALQATEAFLADNPDQYEAHAKVRDPLIRECSRGRNQSATLPCLAGQDHISAFAEAPIPIHLRTLCAVLC
jgi:hypothetical protein